MGSEVGPVQALAIMLGLFFALGDLVILGYVVTRPRAERRHFNRPWSPLDLFLGFQFVLASVVLVQMLALVGLSRAFPSLSPHFPRVSPIVTFFAVLFPVMLIQQVALLLVPIALVRHKYRTSLKELGLRKVETPTDRLVLLGAALAMVALPLSDLIDTLLRRWLIEQPGFPFAEQLRALGRDVSVLTYIEGIRHHPAALLVLVLLFGFVGPIAEEIFFRGFAYRVLRQRFGRRSGMVLSAMLFAAIHVDPISQVPIFLIGLVMAHLYERTGSLAAPIGLHCANNLLTLLSLLLAPEVRLWDHWLPR